MVVIAFADYLFCSLGFLLDYVVWVSFSAYVFLGWVWVFLWVLLFWDILGVRRGDFVCLLVVILYRFYILIGYYFGLICGWVWVAFGVFGFCAW